MEIIELDLTGCTHQIDIQKRIKVAFDFPDWYGHNWDAFRDMLLNEVDADKVILKGIYSLPASLDKPLAIMFKIFEENVQEHKKYSMYLKPFSYEIVS